MPYQSCYSCISPDDKVVLIHSENYINYFLLPNLERIIRMESTEIPELTVFCENNTKLFVLSKGTKQVTYYNLNLEKKHQHVTQILQDRDIMDMRASIDESFLLICSLYCIYVIDLKNKDSELLFKLKTSDIDRFFNVNHEFNMFDSFMTTSKLVSSSLGTSALSMTNMNDIMPANDSLAKTSVKNVFTGFGCISNSNIIYATVYTYLVCYSSETGELLRFFQSTLSANRIIRSYSSLRSDSLVSVLDNDTILIWNLKSVEFKDMKFEDMKIHNGSVIDCLTPEIRQNEELPINFSISYCSQSPDAKVINIKDGGVVSSILKCYDDERLDNPLKTHISLVALEKYGHFCFIVYDIEDFYGKNPEEKDFIKKSCFLINLHDNNRVV